MQMNCVFCEAELEMFIYYINYKLQRVKEADSLSLRVDRMRKVRGSNAVCNL